jgi:hypothetical protein
MATAARAPMATARARAAATKAEGRVGAR